jgi:hypothetical protein
MPSFAVSNHRRLIQNYLRSRKLKALEGRTIVARGK